MGTSSYILCARKKPNDEVYQACGFLVVFSEQDEYIKLCNGLNALSPYKMPAKNFVAIEIPAKTIKDYRVLVSKKIKSKKTKQTLKLL